MKYCSLLFILFIGCSDNFTSISDSIVDSGTEDMEESAPICIPVVCADDECGTKSDWCGNIIQCPVTCQLPFKCDVENKCSCTPKSVDDLCLYNKCGFVNDGCGAWILCGNGDVTSCVNCWTASNVLTCEPGYFAYQCAPNIFPLACFNVSRNYWCCQILG